MPRPLGLRTEPIFNIGIAFVFVLLIITPFAVAIGRNT